MKQKRATDMGAVDEAKGRAKEAVGDVTGNDKLKHEGKVDRGKGKVKDAVDKVADKVTGQK
jgi:uncharacterized protein YjbJ (UPF0337 family)